MGKDAYTLYIRGNCGSVTDTVEILDLFYYNTKTYSSSGEELNIALPTGAFQIEFDFQPLSRTNSSLYIDFGTNTNNRILFGQLAQAGTNGALIYKNGNGTNKYFQSNTNLNVWNHFTFKYDGSNYIISRDNLTITTSDYNISFDKLIHVEGSPNGKLTNIKVHKL